VTAVLAAAAALAATALAALAACRRPRLATGLAAAGAAIAGAVGAAAAARALASGVEVTRATAWQVPGGAFAVGLDPLSAFFLVPVFALGAASAWYGRAYLGARVGPAAALNLLVAAMVLVVVARHGLLFLVAWETMTLLAWLLVTVEHAAAEARRAGWVYLVASHVSMLALVALVVALGEGARSPALLVLALLGFGIKAGAAGAHVWLPEAHAAAPSHVSALMSGALVTMGIYGLLRVALLLAPGPGFATALMILGAAGALLGIALALVQRDLKRALAYSTVENMGIVLLALGLGLRARAAGDPTLAALALAGGLLHVWNHAAMKGLLFLAAGSVVHATGTRDLDRLGGLARRMPWTGGGFLLGAVAIAGLPPLAGFTGEWLIYGALARAALGAPPAVGLAAIGGAAVLALTGALALLAMVRLAGVAFLGAPRSPAAGAAHESPPAMIAPMVALAAACVAAPLAAPWLLDLLGPLLATLGADRLAAAATTLPELALASAALLAVGAVVAAVVRALRAPRVETWGCGYAAPTARMQTGATAFSELLAARVLPRWLAPRVTQLSPAGILPREARFATDAPDPLTRAIYEPALARAGDRFARLRILQQGRVHVYLVYVAATVVAGLGWVALRDWWRP
jgi:formate hydrogenlyase subunit 3/multisubunit Na+/H+ antiporter MnhD subunit